MPRLSGLLFVASLVIGPVAASSRLDVIDLPLGFYPESITNGEGWTAYVSSLEDGSIWKGDLSTGEGEVVVSDGGNPIAGLDHDRRSGYLFAAGLITGTTKIYDDDTFDLVAEITLTGVDPLPFVNDVIVTKTAAYFTDSLQPQIYKVELDRKTGELGDGPDTVATTIPLLGFQMSDGFNANGIVATDDGTLIVANGSTGELYKVDPETGVSTVIDLGGEVLGGDGLVLRKNTMWVVDRAAGHISEVSLSPDLTCGSVAPRALTNPLFSSPTTAMRKGNSFYVVSAKFITPEEDRPTTPYEIVRVDRDGGELACDSEL